MFDLRMPLPMDFIYDVSNHSLTQKWQKLKFNKNQKNWYHAKVLLKRFDLNGHTIGFHPHMDRD